MSLVIKSGASNNTWTINSNGAGLTADQSSSATAAAAPAFAVEDGLVAATAYPTAVTNGQLVGAMGDKAGRSIAVLNAPRDIIGAQATTITASTSNTPFITAGASGVFNDIISLVITNSSATATLVTLTDDGASGNSYIVSIAANGGIVMNFPTPIPQGTAAANWDATCGTSVSSIYIIAVFAKNK